MIFFFRFVCYPFLFLSFGGFFGGDVESGRRSYFLLFTVVTAVFHVIYAGQGKK